MALKEILEANKVPLPPDFDERFKLVMMGLRKDPKFDEELKKFKEQSGGLKLSGMSDKLKSGLSSAKSRFDSGVSSAKNMLSSPEDKIPATEDVSPSLAPPLELDSEDWMGPRIRWFLGAVTSPYARVMLRGLFMIIFFISYLEALPVFGNILSAGLDLMVAGSKAITKAIQRQLPPTLGLLPIPYASLVGMILAGMYGALVWPMIAMVAFSRQDFSAAIESFIRAMPPPVGDTIADLFVEGNRLVARIDMKRRKLANDISIAIGKIANIIESVATKVSEGVSKVTEKMQNISQMKDQAIDRANQFKDQAIDRANQFKDQTIDRANRFKDQSRENPRTFQQKSLDDAFSEIKESPPTTQQISSSLRDLSSKIKNSAKEKISFEPTPVGQGRRKWLSTKRHRMNKWTKTRRIRFAKR